MTTMTVKTLELEITGKCQLACLHCYAESSPQGSHGIMTSADWISVIDQAAAVGVSAIQLIGGEPTLSPTFEPTLRHAVNTGLAVEVYTNLFHVRETWWELFSLPGVSLATSYYSDQADQHDAITTRAGSHKRTTANIERALGLGILLRVGTVTLPDGQPTRAVAELQALGVTNIRSDRLRGIGRAAPATQDPSELCGACGDGKAAISPTGDVLPCVMSRWMVAGNILVKPLADILDGPRWRELVATVPPISNGKKCDPDLCDPVKGDGNDCDPSSRPACDPKFCDPDRKR